VVAPNWPAAEPAAAAALVSRGRVLPAISRRRLAASAYLEWLSLPFAVT
jgi:hypothetical protein